MFFMLKIDLPLYQRKSLEPAVEMKFRRYTCTIFSKIIWFYIKLLFMYRAINPIGWSFDILSQSHGNIWIKISLCYSRCPAIYMVNFIQIFPAVHTYTFIHIDVLHSLTFAFIISIKISINIASCLSMVMLSLVESFSFNHLYSNYIVSNKDNAIAY